MVLTAISQILGFIGSLCLLLFGMEMLSNGIQKGAGNSLQALLRKISGNRFTAVLTGIAITAIIQSSGATTVMVVSFVNAEIITLTQAIGIIFGANIGTTVTAWVVSFFGFSFSIEAAAIPLFGLGFLLKYFKKLKIHNFADCFMGFALLFLGLGLLKTSMNLDPESVAFLQKFSDMGVLGLILGVLIGAVFTALIHSSSATTAIVLTMAANGSLPWNLSAAIVLGSNIGSTVDAVMSSFNASVNAKRTAAVHVAFNVAGTILALLVFSPFLTLVDFIVPGTPQENITTHIAMLHTIFNLTVTLIFLPFVGQIARLAETFIKESKKEQDAHYKFPAILPVSHISSEVYSFQIQKEIAKMAVKVMEMLETFGEALGGDEAEVQQLFERSNLDEEYIDDMNHAIADFLQKCMRFRNANSQDREKFNRMIAVVQNLEDLSDECWSMMHTLTKLKEQKDVSLLEIQLEGIRQFYEQIHLVFEQTCTSIAIGIADEGKIVSLGSEDRISEIKDSLKKESRRRIEDGSDVKTELIYIDLVRKIERAGDCMFTVVKSIAVRR